jgi:hypothetical protein
MVTTARRRNIVAIVAIVAIMAARASARCGADTASSNLTGFK